jgi:zinc protease
VYGQVKSNPEMQAPRGQEGVAEILNGLFAWGTTTLDRLAYQEALDRIGANASAGTSFSLEVLAEHFNRGVQLLADNLLHPAFPEEGFNVLRRQTASALTGELQSPGYLSRRALRTALYPNNDPTLRQATPETVRSLHLEDLKAYYHAVFRPDTTTIVVIGQVTPEQARAVIQKYFGDWKASGPKPATDLPPVPLNEPAATVVPDASRVQDKVTLAQTLGLTRSHPDYYALQVGNHVLSGALYATRLTRDLREQAGLVYGVDSFLEVGKTRGIFGVAYACDPPNVAKARTLVERDLEEMRVRSVSSRELQQAKTLLLRQVPLSESSWDRIGERLLRLSMEELPLDEPTRAVHRYQEITAAEVQAAFAKWIRPRDFVQVTVGPQPD